MSIKTEPSDESVSERLMVKLHSFAVGIGLDDRKTRRIVDRVIADMPMGSDNDRLARARSLMLIASA